MNEPLLLPKPKDDRVTLDEFMFGKGNERAMFGGSSGEPHTINPQNIDSIFRRLEYIHNQYNSIPPGFVELCTVFVQPDTRLPPTPMKIIITRELAKGLARGTETVDALDPLLISLEPNTRAIVKDMVSKLITNTILKYKL